jgi:predicted Zn-dependent peptidase
MDRHFYFLIINTLRDIPGGLAHLTEHVTFRGSRHVPMDRYDFLVREAGGNSNGVTGLDEVRYFVEVPKSNFERALWLESERMALTLEKIDEEGVEREKRTLESEMRASGRLYPSLFEHVLGAICGPNHPYRARSGRLFDLARLEHSDVLSFFGASHRPECAHLTIVGDVEPEAGVRLAERYFGDIGRGGECSEFVRGNWSAAGSRSLHRAASPSRRGLSASRSRSGSGVSWAAGRSSVGLSVNTA